MVLGKLTGGLVAFAALALLAGLVTTSPATAKVKWTCTHFTPKTSGFWKFTTIPWEARLKQLTNGEVQSNCKAVGIIAPGFKGFDAVMEGLADAQHTTTLYIVNKHPVNGFFANHPAGIPAEGYFLWYYLKGGGHDLLTAFHRESLGLQTWGQGYAAQEMWMSHSPVTKLEHLKNKKFRTVGVWANIVNDYFGGNATATPGSEIYVMLERKALDIAEWSGPFENLNKGLFGIAKYVVTPGCHWPGGFLHYSVKKEAWDGLSKDLQGKVMAASKLANFDSYIEWHWADLDAMQKILKKDNVWARLTQDTMDAMSQATKDWAYEKAAEMSKKGDHWMKNVSDSYYAFFKKWNEGAIWKPPLIAGHFK